MGRLNMSCDIVYVGQNDCENHPEQVTVTLQGDPGFPSAYVWAVYGGQSTSKYPARSLGSGVYEGVVDLGNLFGTGRTYTVYGSIGSDECSLGYIESCDSSPGKNRSPDVQKD